MVPLRFTCGRVVALKLSPSHISRPHIRKNLPISQARVYPLVPDRHFWRARHCCENVYLEESLHRFREAKVGSMSHSKLAFLGWII